MQVLTIPMILKPIRILLKSIWKIICLYFSEVINVTTNRVYLGESCPGGNEVGG